MRKCDKKRINKVKQRQKLAKAEKKFERAFWNLSVDLSLDERLHTALSALSNGNLKLIANNSKRFGSTADVASTLIAERIFKLSH